MKTNKVYIRMNKIYIRMTKVYIRMNNPVNHKYFITDSY